MLAAHPRYRHSQPQSTNISSPHHQQQQQQQQQQRWTNPLPILSTPQPLYNTTASNIFAFGDDQPLFDYQPQEYQTSSSHPLMQSEHSNNSWLENGQLTPRSTTRTHHRESSLSSLGSAGPSSPYTANTSNPHIVGDVYHDFHDYPQTSSKPLTPAHTPSQEHFLTPHYSNFYHNSHPTFNMGHDGHSRDSSNAELMPAPELNHSARPSIASVASHDAPSTPPLYDEQRRKNVYRSTMPKLDRTMTDVYADELYNPNFQITSAAQTSNPLPTVTVSPQNDVFQQRLQAANSEHLNTSKTQVPLTIPSRERSPFRQGSPLAPTSNSFAPHSNFGTARHQREQQKAQDDARALQRQLERTSPEQTTPKTISPKDVDLVYHESEEDANAPLFPPQQSQRQMVNFQQPHEHTEVDESSSQQSYGSMATTRRESSSNYSTSSQATQQQGQYNFAPSSVPGSIRQVPQQYPFVPQARRQPSSMSNGTEEFAPTLNSMESSSSEYAADTAEIKKPASTSADTGTYTCTYHGCTLRFDTPAKLQRHKREGHRNSANAIGNDDGGMTSAAQRNSQAGPHKCERINPSTGKPCNTIFSRPYDLTRHEDTIHNARKQKVHCPLCTEEKTFSRNDALTRHLRVVHPEYVDSSRRRRGAHD